MERRKGLSRSISRATLGLGLLLPLVAQAGDAELTLAEAARQALASNLDLVAERQSLRAAREEIGLARSALLPQVGVGARAQVLEADRSDAARGNNKSRSVLLAAGLQQVLYDEKSWSNFEIQRHVYEGEARQLDASELDVVRDAAGAFLDLDRSQRVLEIEQLNREITRRNLETSRSRIAAGWSSDREVLRWESQLAANDTSVRTAQARVLQDRFALNRVRNLSAESPVTPRPASIEEHGFVYARAPIAEAVADADDDRRLRDALVRVGLLRSPDLAAIDASIAAAERQLVASRRAFWVPSLDLAAGVDHLANGGSGEDFKQSEWMVKGELTFPLFLGGAKFSGLEQARQTLASLRSQRSAATQSLDQSIRSAFAQATASYESVGFARRQTQAAQRSFELVEASYRLGVASILDLLDAQEQLLDARVGEVEAVYGFLGDLVAAERAISFYAFLEPSSEVEALLDQLELELGIRP